MCGIYIIRNTVTDKLYIGKSVDIKKRFNTHKHNLRNGRHCNKYLQRAWDKYGESAFEFCVLEECERDKLNALEIATIEKYANTHDLYNMTDGGDGLLGHKRSDETKALIGMRNSHKVVLLNTGRIFRSYGEAAKCYGITDSAIVNACSGKAQSAGRENGVALAWAKYDTYLSMSKSEVENKVSVAQDGLKYDTKEVVLLNTGERFCSARIASRAYSHSVSNICACCRHEHRFAGSLDGINLVWRYAEEYDAMSESQVQQAIKSGNALLTRRVVLLNTGEVFDSIALAATAYGLDRNAVYSNCNGLRMSGGTHNGTKLAWAYEDEYLSMSQDDILRKITTAADTRECAKKQVRLVNTGAIFPSISAAAKSHQLQRKGIAQCCDGLIHSYGKINNSPMVWAYC